MKMTFKTKMRKNAGSMITVVPAGLLNLLKIESGDELIWNVDITAEGATVTVEPIRQSKKE